MLLREANGCLAAGAVDDFAACLDPEGSRTDRGVVGCAAGLLLRQPGAAARVEAGDWSALAFVQSDAGFFRQNDPANDEVQLTFSQLVPQSLVSCP